MVHSYGALDAIRSQRSEDFDPYARYRSENHHAWGPDGEGEYDGEGECDDEGDLDYGHGHVKPAVHPTIEQKTGTTAGPSTHNTIPPSSTPLAQSLTPTTSEQPVTVKQEAKTEV